jgi:hypothetical protein
VEDNLEVQERIAYFWPPSLAASPFQVFNHGGGGGQQGCGGEFPWGAVSALPSQWQDPALLKSIASGGWRLLLVLRFAHWWAPIATTISISPHLPSCCVDPGGCRLLLDFLPFFAGNLTCV